MALRKPKQVDTDIELFEFKSWHYALFFGFLIGYIFRIIQHG